MHAELARRFEETYQRIPRYGGPVDLQVLRFVHGMACWGSAVFWWSFECDRYFGTKARQVLETKRMTLLPRKVVVDWQEKEKIQGGKRGCGDEIVMEGREASMMKMMGPLIVTDVQA